MTFTLCVLYAKSVTTSKPLQRDHLAQYCSGINELVKHPYKALQTFAKNASKHPDKMGGG